MPRGRPKKEATTNIPIDPNFEEPKDERCIKKDDEEKKLPPVKLTSSYFGGKRIEIETHEQVENKTPLPKGFVGGVICGSSGEGKTYLMLSLITQFTKLSQIMVLTKIVGNPVYNAIEAYCLNNKIKYGFASEPEDAAELIESYVKEKEEGTFSLTIFDDFNNGSSHSRDDKYNKLVIMTYQLLRNYNNHCLTVTQSYVGVNTLIRNNMSFLVLFRMKSKPAIQRACTDWTNMTGKDDDKFYKIYNLVMKEKHAYLLVNDTGTYVYLPSEGEQIQKIQFNDDEDN